jgi:F-box/WD-40 domain protein 7
MAIQMLPHEVLLHIVSYLQPESTLLLSGVCKELNKIAKDIFHWRNLCEPNGLFHHPQKNWKASYANNSLRLLFHRIFSHPLLSFKTFKAHSDKIPSIYANDGKIYTASHDGMLSQRSFEDPEVGSKIHFNGRRFTSITSYNQCIISGMTHERVVFLENQLQREIYQLKTYTEVMQLQSCNDLIFFRGDGKIMYFNPLVGHSRNAEVNYLKFSNAVTYFQVKQSTLFTGHLDGTVQIHDMRSGCIAMSCLMHDKPITSLCYGEKDSYLFTGSCDSMAALMDLRMGACAMVYAGHQKGISCLTASDHLLITSSYDRTIRLWDTATGRNWGFFPGHEDGITAICTYKDTIISSGYDQNLIFSSFFKSCLTDFSYLDF